MVRVLAAVDHQQMMKNLCRVMEVLVVRSVWNAQRLDLQPLSGSVSGRTIMEIAQLAIPDHRELDLEAADEEDDV